MTFPPGAREGHCRSVHCWGSEGFVCSTRLRDGMRMERWSGKVAVLFYYTKFCSIWQASFTEWKNVMWLYTWSNQIKPAFRGFKFVRWPHEKKKSKKYIFYDILPHSLKEEREEF